MRKSTIMNATCTLVLLAALVLGFGCAPKSKGITDATAEGYGSYGSEGKSSVVDKRVRDYLAAEKNDERGQDVLIRTAKTALGTPYVRGGTSTDGFDCSGFVQWTFNQVGVKLPRTAREQSRVGRAIRNLDDMQVGDIVAFHHPKRGYHTGIYVGDGKFIHSPRKRTRVRINSMDDPYFSKTFMGARRIGVSSPEDIQAAEKMLAEYRESEARRARTETSKRKEVARADTKRGSKSSASVSRSRKGGKDAKAKDVRSRESVSKDKKKSSVGQARPPATKSVARADTKSKPQVSTRKAAAENKQQAKASTSKSSKTSSKAAESKASSKKTSSKTTVAKKSDTNAKKKGS